MGHIFEDLRNSVIYFKHFIVCIYLNTKHAGNLYSVDILFAVYDVYGLYTAIETYM